MSRPIAETPAAQPPAERPRWIVGDEGAGPVRLPLTRRRIVIAALALVEEHGLEALTMRRVASELNVTPMSLYNHISDKAELIDLMVDFILADVVAEPIDPQADWADNVRIVARRTYQTWIAHPGFARVYTDGVTVGPHGLANIERLLGVLRQAGFSNADSARIFFMVYQYVISSLLVAPAKPLSLRDRATRSDGSGDRRIELYLSALPTEEIPNVAAVAGHLSGNDFEFGLEILLAGLQVRLETTSSASTDRLGRQGTRPVRPTGAKRKKPVDSRRQ